MHDIEDLDSVQVELESGLNALGPVMVGNQLDQHRILSESAAAGGPISQSSAVATLLDYVKIGVRPLAVELKMKRKELQQMIAGEIEMPPGVIGQIWDVIEKKKPGLLDRLKSMKFDD